MLEEILTLTRGVFASIAQDREQRESRENRFLRALQPADALAEAIAENLRANPNPDPLAGYRAFLSDGFPARGLKPIGGDFRVRGGDVEITKKPAKNALSAEDTPE